MPKEKIDERAEQTGLKGQEELEVELVGGLSDVAELASRCREKVLGLTDDEAMALGRSEERQQKAGQQQRDDEVVVGDVVGNGFALLAVACPTPLHEKRVAREDGRDVGGILKHIGMQLLHVHRLGFGQTLQARWHLLYRCQRVGCEQYCVVVNH